MRIPQHDRRTHGDQSSAHGDGCSADRDHPPTNKYTGGSFDYVIDARIWRYQLEDDLQRRFQHIRLDQVG